MKFMQLYIEIIDEYKDIGWIPMWINLEHVVSIAEYFNHTALLVIDGSVLKVKQNNQLYSELMIELQRSSK